LKVELPSLTPGLDAIEKPGGTWLPEQLRQQVRDAYARFRESEEVLDLTARAELQQAVYVDLKKLDRRMRQIGLDPAIEIVQFARRRRQKEQSRPRRSKVRGKRHGR
jgi:hypothetical protein